MSAVSAATAVALSKADMPREVSAAAPAAGLLAVWNDGWGVGGSRLLLLLLFAVFVGLSISYSAAHKMAQTA